MIGYIFTQLHEFNHSLYAISSKHTMNTIARNLSCNVITFPWSYKPMHKIHLNTQGLLALRMIVVMVVVYFV